MLSHYSPRSFLRQASNQLLREYFDGRQCSLEVDWEGLGETSIEALYEAWLVLPEQQQRMTDADFAEINELATSEGVAVLIEEGLWDNLPLNETFERFDDVVDMAMWTFVRHPKVFRIGSLFSNADNISQRSWKRWKELPTRKPRDDQDTRKQLEGALSNHYLRTEGRGRNCKVEVYQRSGDYYYFAFPEDHARAEQDYVNGVLVRQTHRPVFQVVAVYSPGRGTIDVSAPGGKRAVARLADIILAIILEVDRPPNPKDDRIYDLELLRRRDHVWVYPADAGISTVWLKALRLTFKAGRDKLVLEGTREGAVHDRYEQLFGTNGKMGLLDPNSFFATQAVLRVEYAPRDGQSVRPRDVRITWPNGCNLKQDERDRVLRKMLITSGIDPQKLGLDAQR